MMHWLDDDQAVNQSEIRIALQQRLNYLPNLRHSCHYIGRMSLTMNRCVPGKAPTTFLAISNIRAILKPRLPVLMSYTHTVPSPTFSSTSIRIEFFVP